jgi:hypothetical protein
MFDISHRPSDATCVGHRRNAAIRRRQQAIPRRGPGSVHDRGRIAPDQYGEFAVLNADYLTVPEERIKDVEPLLTVRPAM